MRGRDMIQRLLRISTIGIAVTTVALALTLISQPPHTARAATYVVTTTNDAGEGSLRQAITAANAARPGPNTITFTIPGTGPHRITLASPLPTITGNVHIHIDAGNADITISGNNAEGVLEPGHPLGIFTVANGAHLELSGTNFTLTDGLRGIYSSESTVSISGLTIRDNIASWVLENVTGNNGGGIDAIHSQIYIHDTIFINNFSDNWGGAISILSSTLHISGSLISHNDARVGGGIAIWGCNDCDWTGPSTVTITDSKISHNTSIRSGAGIFSVSGGLAIASSTILDNHAGSAGGGIYASDGSLVLIFDSSVISHNYARWGGGIYATSHESTGETIVEIRDSAITFNTSEPGSGSAIYNHNESTIIASNNWWGSPPNPFFSGRFGGHIDRITYAPFKTTAPSNSSFASGITFHRWDGRSYTSLESLLGTGNSAWITVHGEFLGYVIGAPAIVNTRFRNHFPGSSIPAGVIMLIVVE